MQAIRSAFTPSADPIRVESKKPHVFLAVKFRSFAEAAVYMDKLRERCSNAEARGGHTGVVPPQGAGEARLGPERQPGDPNLGPEVGVGRDVLRYEADRRNMDPLVEELGVLKEPKSFDLPMAVEPAGTQEGDRELGSAETARFRRVDTLAKDLAAKRPDIQAAVGHLCGAMSKPTEGSCNALQGGGGT